MRGCVSVQDIGEQHKPSPTWNAAEHFDLMAMGAIVALVVTIVAVIASGDRAGVGITDRTPLGNTHATAMLRISFAEPMDTASVDSRFSIEPAIIGQLTWSNTSTTSTLNFKPDLAWASGQRYTVTIKAGAASLSGRKLSADELFTFDVNPARVVYIAPAVDEQAPANLWTVDPSAPFVVKQLTFTSGILPDYAVSPDGTRIVYAQKEKSGGADLYIVNTDTNETQRLTQCVEALCQLPSWSPDGTRIVYERIDLGASLAESDREVPRPWLLNLSDLSTAPLLPSSQLLGHAPRWSPTGTEIAVYDLNVRSIVIYNLNDGSSKVIQTLDGETGLFDPSGARMVYPDVLQTPSGFFSTLAIANLSDPRKGILTIEDADSSTVEDRQAAWYPDGSKLVVARRYLDRRSTQGTQVVVVDLATMQAVTLINDPLYNHGALSWSPSGNALVMQRFPFAAESPDGSQQPGIWVYDIEAKTLRQVAKNGYLPQWLP
jgi:Tol biopolymer transport system component